MARLDAQPDAPRLLAFDTSTELLAIGLHDGAESFRLQTVGGMVASQQLLPQLQELLQRAGLSLVQLDGIAFGRGPGAFTGLRTACSVAQGLALGLQLPLLPIDSLLIVAEDARAQVAGVDAGTPFDVAVVMDARMNEIYAGRYRFSPAEGHWHTVLAPMLVTPDALAAQLAGPGGAAPPVVAGSGLAAFDLRRGLAPGTVCIAAEHDRAGALLRLARQAHAAQGSVDAAEALPLYLRDKVAQTSAERARAKSVAAPR